MSLPKLCDFLASVPPKESTYILIRNNFITIPLMADLSEAGIPLAGMHEEKSAVHLMQTGYEKNSFKYHEISTLVNNSIFPAVKYFTPRAKGKLKKLLGSSLSIPEEGFTIDEMKGFGMTDLFFRDLKKKDCTNLKIEPAKFKYIMKLIEKYGYSANPVHIVTIHQFKGMEADNIVIVPDITKTCYENENARGYNQSAVESERRVWYTAVTRARKNLILLDRTTYSNYKSRIYNVISDHITHSA